jgi:hypothetical protein
MMLCRHSWWLGISLLRLNLFLIQCLTAQHQPLQMLATKQCHRTKKLRFCRRTNPVRSCVFIVLGVETCHLICGRGILLTPLRSPASAIIPNDSHKQESTGTRSSAPAAKRRRGTMCIGNERAAGLPKWQKLITNNECTRRWRAGIEHEHLLVEQ